MYATSGMPFRKVRLDSYKAYYKEDSLSAGLTTGLIGTVAGATVAGVTTGFLPVAPVVSGVVLLASACAFANRRKRR